MITVFIIIIFVIIIIIIQGKDDTKLNKEINGWSQTVQSFFYWRGGAMVPHRYAVVSATVLKPPRKDNLWAESLIVFFYYYYILFSFDQISWSFYFL